VVNPDRWVETIQAEAHGRSLVLSVISNPVTRSEVALRPPVEIHGPEEMEIFSTWFLGACKGAWDQVPRVDLTELDASDWRGDQHAVL